MNKLLKDKKVLGGIIAGVVLLLLVGGMLFLRKPSTTPLDSMAEDTRPVTKIAAADIGLTITLSPDKKRVKFIADNLSDYKEIEWEFFYDAEASMTGDFAGEPGQMVTQSFGGEAEVENGAYESEYRELGSCSTGGKCRFDTGVEKVNLLMKLVKNDGSLYQIEESLEL